MINTEAFNSFCRKYRLEIWIFAAAFLARLILFSLNYNAAGLDLIPTIHGDDGYYEISQGLLSGHGFTGSPLPPYDPTPLRPPLWPAIIAGIVFAFKSYWAVLVLELILGSLIPVLGLYIADKLLGNKPIAVATGMFLVIEPYGVLMSSLLYSETIFTFLFLAFFIFVIRYCEAQNIRNAVWMAMFLGLSILAKSTVQYLPFIVPFFMLYMARKNISGQVWKNVAAFILISLTLIGPWIYRNYREFGVVGMSAQPAFNLYVYLVPTVLSIDNKTNFATEIQSYVYDKGVDVNSINLSNSKYYSDEAMKVLRLHKTALAKSFGNSIVTFFTHEGMLTVLGHAEVRIVNALNKPALTILLDDPGRLASIISTYVRSPAILVLLGRLVWIFITIFFVAGIWLAWRGKKISLHGFVALLIVLYFALTTAINGLGVNARFRTPVNVFIFTFAVYGFTVLTRYMARKRALKTKNGP